MQYINTLEQLGLSSKSSQIYMALIGCDSLTVSGISRKTGIHRPLIYKELPTLIEMNLVSVSKKGKRKVFVAESPSRLDWQFNKLKEEMSSALPKLLEVYEGSKNSPSYRVVEGKTGLMLIWEDLVTNLKKGDAYYRFTSEKDIKRTLHYCPKNYKKRRDAKKLERYIITNKAISDKKTSELFRHIKLISEEDAPFGYEVTQLIYKDTVVFMDFNSETAFILEGNLVAQFHRHIFMSLWKLLPGPIK